MNKRLKFPAHVVSIQDFRDHTGPLLKRVKKGETIVIRQYNEPMYVLKLASEKERKKAQALDGNGERGTE